MARPITITTSEWIKNRWAEENNMKLFRIKFDEDLSHKMEAILGELTKR